MTNELKRAEVVRVYFKDLEMVGNGKYIGEEYWYQGKPFYGFVIFDYHKNGNIMFETEHANGQTMGWHVEYYEDGKISYERLNFGATTVLYRYYDVDGNITEEYWPGPTHYNSVAKETGMEPLEE